MEKQEKIPDLTIQSSLEKISGISEIQKLELSNTYFSDFPKESEVRDSMNDPAASYGVSS